MAEKNVAAIILPTTHYLLKLKVHINFFFFFYENPKKIKKKKTIFYIKGSTC
jgi:hypothetical protein